MNRWNFVREIPVKTRISQFVDEILNVREIVSENVSGPPTPLYSVDSFTNTAATALSGGVIFWIKIN